MAQTVTSGSVSTVLLKAGHNLTVTPEIGGAVVSWDLDGPPNVGRTTVSTTRVFGPFLHDLTFTISALNGASIEYSTTPELDSVVQLGTSGTGDPQDYATAEQGALADAHRARTDNPHSTTKAQVGLGNVDNTSDETKAATGNAVGDAIAAKYTKPGSGIPSSDLASAVQASLGKADTALQEANALVIKGPYSFTELNALSTTGFVAGVTQAQVDEPAHRVGTYTWMGGSDWVKEGNIVKAERFGIKASSSDNTTALAVQAAWWAALGADETYCVEYPAGVFLADKIEFGPVNQTPIRTASLILKGAGGGLTKFKPRTSSEPVFFTLLTDYWFQCRIEDITLEGIGATNAGQQGFAALCSPRPGDDTGGITDSVFRNFHVSGFDGQAGWLKGSTFFDGIWASRLPMQGLQFDQCSFTSSAHHALEVLGQFGQVRFSQTAMQGAALTNPGANCIISCDYRNANVAISSVDASTDTFTSTDTFRYPNATPFRFIGSDLPGGFSKGTTYWCGNSNLGGSSSNINHFKLYASRAAAGVGTTPVNATTTGTAANFTLVPLWATGLSANEFTTEFPHKLQTSDRLRPYGSNLSTNLVSGTAVYVIRTGHLTFKLANSEANAKAGTALTITGGTLADFGFIVGDAGASNMSGAYSVVFDLVSNIYRREGFFFNRAHGVQIRSTQMEQVMYPFRLHDSTGEIGTGRYEGSAADSGAGVWLVTAGTTSRIKVSGTQYMLGQPDKVLTNEWAAVDLATASWAYAEGNPVPSLQSSGKWVNVGQSGGTLDVQHYDRVFCNTSGTTINTLTSKVCGIGQEVRVVAWGGSIVIGSSGNIKLANAPLTVPENGCVTFERVDTIGTFLLTNVSF